ncbi:MAG: hypothetical protein K2N74_05810 [Clostridiales bacterium]|nr:hypothetical protein [Clostridiales bacterium]
MIYTEEEKELIAVSFNGKDRLLVEDAERLIKTSDTSAYNSIAQTLEKQGIVCVTYHSPYYPEPLKNIS